MRTHGAVVALAICGVLEGGCPSARAGSLPGAIDIAQALRVLNQEIAAVAAWGGDAHPAVRLEEVHLDLQLVEVQGGHGARLAVPTASFNAGGGEAAKPPLRRHLSIDLTPPRDSTRANVASAAEGAPDAVPPEQGPVKRGRLVSQTASPAQPAHAGTAAQGSVLARVIADAGVATQQEFGSGIALQAKRVVVDLDFMLDDNPQGVAAVVVFPGARRVDPRNVQKLRVKLATPTP